MTNPEGELGTITIPSIIVAKEYGAETLKVVKKLCLIDARFKVKVQSSTVAIPLTRKPAPIEIQTIRDIVKEYSIQESEFEPRPFQPTNIDSALQIGEGSNKSISFDIVGDIAILEIDTLLDISEHKVAEALMKVHSNVHSVFAKAGPVSGTDRIRLLRHIAGENRTRTVHREHGARFQVDLSRAFFSPRLSTEHLRVVQKVQEAENVLDMFAGIGPFSILIAKKVKDVKVNAIDLNVEATKLLKENALLNKVQDKITIWTGDANRIISEHLIGSASRIIMNHPSESMNFLASAVKALSSKGGIIHYYTFSQEKEPWTSAIQKFVNVIENNTGVVKNILNVRQVREIAPFTWQLAIEADVMKKYVTAN